MNRIIALAHITFLNGLRRNAVWGLCLFALLLEICGVLFMDFFGRGLGRVICDFQFSIMWIAGMLFILFYAIQALAWDDEHRSIDSILARPISRIEYVWGSMLGLSLLLLCFELLLATLAIAEILWVKPMVGAVHFPIFSIPHFIITWLGLQTILLAHLAVVILISAAIRGAFPVMLITLAYSLICSGLPVVRESLQHATESASQSLSHLLQFMTMFFPDFGTLDFKNSILSLEHFDAVAWAFPFGLTCIYIAIILLLSCIIYQRRDIL